MRIFQKYYYVKLYEGNNYRQNCGYVKVESMNQRTKLVFYIMNLSNQLSSVAEVYLYTGKERQKISNIFIRQGKCRDVVYINQGYADGDIEVIRIPINERVTVGYRLDRLNQVEENINRLSDRKLSEKEKREPEKQDEEKENKETNSSESYSNEKEEIVSSEDNVQPIDVEPYIAMDTKWEQLKKTYPNIHIFEDEAEVLLIKPQDLVVLTEQYQNLISNSFLLHGYYNYRQLLLLKWKQEEGKYYVGVPGNYHDREKNVAIMFGFESFENGESSRREGQKDGFPGAFGYYLKQVEI